MTDAFTHVVLHVEDLDHSHVRIPAASRPDGRKVYELHDASEAVVEGSNGATLRIRRYRFEADNYHVNTGLNRLSFAVGPSTPIRIGSYSLGAVRALDVTYSRDTFGDDQVPTPDHLILVQRGFDAHGGPTIIALPLDQHISQKLYDAVVNTSNLDALFEV